ncbi:epsin N-terminal domain-containing family protein [Salix suchowensis]|nr:epsin N-terminal domain-containing family protein [Salix suchowensis]
MSVLSKSNGNYSTGTPSFHELKKQASFFFKGKIKSARLALTDVTPAELLTEEATHGNSWAPDNPTLGSISRAAFEVDDYWRIVGILHKSLFESFGQIRLLRFERKNWRPSYNSLIVLEHLLTHGPGSVAGEFQTDKDVIREMESFQCIDEKGFNWGLAVRKKSERILNLLEEGPLLKEERERARRVTRGIQGFGSFCHSSSSARGILQESSNGTFARVNSQNDFWENQFSSTKEENSIQTFQKSGNDADYGVNLDSCDSVNNCQLLEKSGTNLKENLAPTKEMVHLWNDTWDANPLLAGRRDEQRIIEEDHPFSDAENQTTASLLSARDGIMQGC